MSPVVREDDEAFPDVPSVEFGGTPQGRINYLSVSQLKTAKLCLRKWWLKKVAGLEEPKSAALELGILVHEQLEHYLKSGDDVLGEIARAALPYLPKPKTAGVVLEQPITREVRPISGALVEADGIPLVGFIDRKDDQIPRVPCVTDYKTSSNPSKWGATREQLVTTEHEHGVQMVGYALAAFKTNPDAVAADLEHLTLNKRPTKADRRAGADVRQTIATITPKRARDEWERMNLLARTLRQVVTIPKVEDTPSSWGTDACEAFGGCHFRGTCLVAECSKSQPPPEPEKRKMSSLKDILARRRAAANPPMPDVQTAVSPEAVDEVIASNPPPVEPVPEVVPPDAPKSDPKLAAEQPPEPKPESEPVEKPKRAKKSKAGEVPEGSPEPNAPKKSDDTGGVRNGNDAALSVASSSGANKPGTSPADGFGLFVDCVPTCDVALFSKYVGDRVDEIKAAFPDLIDIRNAPKKGKNAEGKEVDHPLAYGAWKGVLAAQCRLKPPKGNVTALGVYGSEFMQVAIEALEPLAALVVRGVR